MRKYFSLSLLWLACLAMCTHLIIIHDHHSNCSDLQDNDTCPATADKDGHHTGSPIHCHAFNDVASEKAISFQVSIKIPCNTLTINSIIEDYDLELPLIDIAVFHLRDPFPDSAPPDSSPLRAPPSLG